MTKISQLSQDTNPQSADQVAIVDSISGATKRMTFSDLSKIMQTLLMPAGVVQETAVATAPSGWLICDGSAISRTSYASLFAAIGTTYGTGDGSTTFNIPDLRGRTAVGVGTATGAAGATAHTLGQKAGEETHTLSIAEMPSHDHAMYNDYGATKPSYLADSTWSTPIRNVSGTGPWNNGGNMQPSGGGGGHNNMQPYVALNFIIKT